VGLRFKTDARTIAEMMAAHLRLVEELKRREMEKQRAAYRLAMTYPGGQ
jgi:hypothetical protein